MSPSSTLMGSRAAPWKLWSYRTPFSAEHHSVRDWWQLSWNCRHVVCPACWTLTRVLILSEHWLSLTKRTNGADAVKVETLNVVLLWWETWWSGLNFWSKNVFCCCCFLLFFVTVSRFSVQIHQRHLCCIYTMRFGWISQGFTGSSKWQRSSGDSWDTHVSEKPGVCDLLKILNGGNYRAKLSRCGYAGERSRDEPEKKEVNLLQHQKIKLGLKWVHLPEFLKVESS